MSGTEPLHAPPALTAMVRGEIYKKGLTRHETTKKVVPFVQTNESPNRYTPKGQPRWVAMCPECPGAEVVPAEGKFECGSCGATAEVDWSNV